MNRGLRATRNRGKVIVLTPWFLQFYGGDNYSDAGGIEQTRMLGGVAGVPPMLEAPYADSFKMARGLPAYCNSPYGFAPALTALQTGQPSPQRWLRSQWPLS